MLLAAAIVTASINIEIDLGRVFGAKRKQSPAATCGIRVVGYHFTGTPGRKFRYAGDTYVMPEEGWIELIADRRSKTYRIDNRSLPLDGFPLNQFGFAEVPLPSEQPAVAQEASR